MSQIQVTTLESNTVSANVITAGQTTVNSTGLYLGKTETEYSGVVRRNSLVIGANDLDYTLSNDFNNSSDSYTAGGATITNFATYIRLTSSSTDPVLQTPSLNYYGTQIGKIVIKIRRIAGSGWDGSVFHATSGHSFSESYKMLMVQPSWVGTEWAYIQLDASNPLTGGNDFITNFVTQMRFDFGSTISDIFEIDYIRFYPISVLTDIVSAPSITIGGTTYTSIINEAVNTQIFTANGTWSKPSWANTGNELVVVHAWGGGGGGYNDAGAGGGGGAFVFGYFKSSQCNSTCNVVVGRAGLNQPFNAATAGGDSIFYANTTNSLVAYGGGPGRSDLAAQAWGGGGGGWLSAGSGNTSGTYPGGPLTRSANSTTEAIDSTFGGGGGGWGNTTTGSRSSTASVYGGGGGAGTNTSLVLGGSSIFGGAGGRSTGPVLTSVYGGNGGNNTVAATTPGGGGGKETSAARGEVRIYTYRIIA